MELHPHAKMMDQEKHDTMIKSCISVQIHPPYWLHTTINGVSVRFVVNSGSAHNTMDRQTADKIGLVERYFSKSIMASDLRSLKVKQYIVYLNVRV